MIKFKEFNVGDADYKEQMEQFQTEHQNAEFVQITGGHMSYEKIWFKYELSGTSATTDEKTVEKLQEQLNTAKKELTEEIESIEKYLDKYGMSSYGANTRQAYLEGLKKALAAIGNEGSGDE